MRKLVEAQQGLNLEEDAVLKEGIAEESKKEKQKEKKVIKVGFLFCVFVFTFLAVCVRGRAGLF